MSRKLLLFGFEELPTILAAAAAADHAPANGIFYSFFTVIHKEILLKNYMNIKILCLNY